MHAIPFSVFHFGVYQDPHQNISDPKTFGGSDI